MIKGKLDNGFEYEINDSFFNDWEVLELIHDIENDGAKVVDLSRKMFTAEKLDELKEICKVDGVIKMDKMIESITTIVIEHSKN